MHGMLIPDPDEIRRVADFYADKPVAFYMIMCCPIYTVIGLNLVIKVAEKAPSYQQVKSAISSCNCCKRIEIARNEFIKTQENGLLAALFTKEELTRQKME